MNKFILLFSLALIQHFTLIAQTKLDPGDIQFLAFRTDAPDGFSVVVWKNLADSTEIRFTDNGWGATDSLGFSHQTENSLSWLNTSGGFLPAGTVLNFYCQGNSIIPNLGTTFGSLCGLSSAGDQIFAFQGTLDSCRIIAGINFEGNTWQNDRFNTNSSAEPFSIRGSFSSIAIPEVDNARCMSIRFAHPIWQYQIWNSDLDNSWIFENDGNNMPAMDTAYFEVVGFHVKPESGPDSLWIETLSPRTIRVNWSMNSLDTLVRGFLVSGFSTPSLFRPADGWVYTDDYSMSDLGVIVNASASAQSVVFSNIPPSTKFIFSVSSFGLGSHYPIYNREKERRIYFESLSETIDAGLAFQDSAINVHSGNTVIQSTVFNRPKPIIEQTDFGFRATHLLEEDKIRWEVRAQSGRVIAEGGGPEFYWKGTEKGLVLLLLFVNDEIVASKKVFLKS